MKEFIFILKNIAKGKSVTRSMLDYRLKREFLLGTILDLGAGKRDLYSNFIPREKDSVFTFLDVKQGASIDFEKDALPYENNSFDTVLLLNVLEHLFNYTVILKEIFRIKKEQGTLVGFVPFLMWYHPDNHDYFRYTHEALEKILKECGYTNVSIEIIYKGPYTTALQMVYPTFPRFIRALLFLIVYPLDVLFGTLRKNGARRYALGYYFRAV